MSGRSERLDLLIFFLSRPGSSPVPPSCTGTQRWIRSPGLLREHHSEHAVVARRRYALLVMRAPRRDTVKSQQRKTERRDRIARKSNVTRRARRLMIDVLDYEG